MTIQRKYKNPCEALFLAFLRADDSLFCTVRDHIVRRFGTAGWKRAKSHAMRRFEAYMARCQSIKARLRSKVANGQVTVPGEPLERFTDPYDSVQRPLHLTCRRTLLLTRICNGVLEWRLDPTPGEDSRP